MKRKNFAPLNTLRNYNNYSKVLLAKRREDQKLMFGPWIRSELEQLGTMKREDLKSEVHTLEFCLW